MISLAALGATAPPRCPDDCVDIKNDEDGVANNIARLQEIRKINVDFIHGLGPDEESKRIKANSNVYIADKRIDLEKTKIQELTQKAVEKGCSSCKEN